MAIKTYKPVTPGPQRYDCYRPQRSVKGWRPREACLEVTQKKELPAVATTVMNAVRHKGAAHREKAYHCNRLSRGNKLGMDAEVMTAV